ncbi:MAG: TonB-dependent receptor [Rikenellaceae bacterium]|jgi:hypothetical protein|nr:TonB-dependent receptor [Rikenellaceae bacterium]
MKKLLFIILLAAWGLSAFAQGGASVSGTVTQRGDRAPLDGIRVSVNTPTPVTVTTDAEGRFTIEGLPDGVWDLSFESSDYMATHVTTRVAGAAARELNVSLAPRFVQADQTADSFTEFDTETGDDSQAMPVVLSASGDVFDNMASYNFSQMRFRLRGLNTSTNYTYFNGIMLNDAQTGNSGWTLWSGLNDVTRNQESTSGLAIPDLGVASLDGTSTIHATASQVRPGWRIGLVNSNASYRFRGMVTYASGESPRGWSYAFSAGTRQGGNDWVRGVNYNAFSYYAGVEKRLTRCDRLALTIFGTPTERGTQAAATQETYDLVGSNYYNPNWGFQGGNGGNSIRSRESGTVRNARERIYHEPVAILNYTRNFNENNTLTAAVSYRFGQNGYTALDWYSPSDPRPDYYRKLPSYDASTDTDWNQFGSMYYQDVEGWHSDWNTRQVDWDAMYRRNWNSYFNEDDVANPQMSTNMRRSQYVVEERRTDQRDLNAAVQFVSVLTTNYKLSAGAAYRWNRTEYYKVMNDLLGGDGYLDVNKFASGYAGGDTIQNNVDDPNRIIKAGDKYGYDYYGHVRIGRLWVSLRYNWRSIEAYAAAEGGHTEMWREGRYRNGLFMDNSKGDSEKKEFWTYTGKLGATWKINGNHVVWANAAYITSAPYFAKSMVSPRTRNEWVRGLKTQKSLAVDANYSLRLKWIRMRVTGYYVDIKDQVDIISFYDDTKGQFSNFSMSGIDQRNMGIEWGFQMPLIGDLTLSGALSYGYWVYSSDPYVTQTVDNSSRVVMDNQRVYWKDYKVPGAPQTAASLALNYRARGNWFLGLDGGFYDANYISMNPMRRVDPVYVGLTWDESVAMAKQEKFGRAFVMNASVGKYWILKGTMLGFNLSAYNMLNNKNIRTGGYEQMRLRKTTDSATSTTTYSPFDSKYFYLFGANYYLNIYYRF